MLTRDELVAEILADGRFAGLQTQLRSGWGALLKPLAWQGALCCGPSQGSNVTFTGPASVIPGWRGLPEPDEAAPLVIAAYLGAYGPATPEVFDAWLTRSRLKKSVLRRWFADMAGALAEVDVEGRKAYILAEHADELAGGQPNESVRLLGGFDQYILGPGTKDPHMLPAQHREKVSKTSGWISPVLLVGGRITGTWELADGEIIVSLFPGAAQPSITALQSETSQVAHVAGLDHLEVRTA